MQIIRRELHIAVAMSVCAEERLYLSEEAFRGDKVHFLLNGRQRFLPHRKNQLRGCDLDGGHRTGSRTHYLWH
jgi:hypothetical protein